MVSDRYQTSAVGKTDPAEDGFSITPDDNSNLPEYTRGIYIGGAGDIVIQTKKGTELYFVGCLAGTFLPIRAKKVLSSSASSPTVITTATNLIGLV